MEQFDASLQDFSYTFDCGARHEKLSFRTFKPNGSTSELEEILSVYGSADVMFQVNGVDEIVRDAQQAENVRSEFLQRTSLRGSKQSIRWKLYYTRDIDSCESKEVFVGFVGMSLLDSNCLEPHVRLSREYHRKGLGTKSLLCLVQKLLSNKDWLLTNVHSLFMEIHPMNTASLELKNKLLLNLANEQRNDLREDGVWVQKVMFFADKKFRPIFMRHFVCSDINALARLFQSKLNLRVNKADRRLLKESAEESGGSPHDDVEASLQDFSYTFDYGQRREKLSFRTLRKPGSRVEVDEVYSIFGNANIMKYYCSEIPIKNKTEALRMRERLRKETSLWGEKQGIRWKLSYSRDITGETAQEVFIGFIGLFKVGRMLEPVMCLDPAYCNKGFGSRALLCLLVKLYSNKSWLLNNFDGIEWTISPENHSSFALKRKLLQGADKEEKNDNHPDGIWVITRKEYFGDRQRDVFRRKFCCSSLAVLEKLLLSKMTEKINKAVLVVHDKEEKLSYTVSTFDLYRKLGVKQLQLYSEDVYAFVRLLMWPGIQRTVREEKEFSVVNAFDVALPSKLCQTQGPPSSETFFLLFFAEDFHVQPFEVMTCDRSRKYIVQEFIAFRCLTRKSTQLKLRMVNDSFVGFRGYLVELDMDAFETKLPLMTQNDLQTKVKNTWATGEFTYKRKKRRRWPGEFDRSLVLETAKFMM